MFINAAARELCWKGAAPHEFSRGRQWPADPRHDSAASACPPEHLLQAATAPQSRQPEEASDPFGLHAIREWHRVGLSHRWFRLRRIALRQHRSPDR